MTECILTIAKRSECPLQLCPSLIWRSVFLVCLFPSGRSPPRKTNYVWTRVTFIICIHCFLLEIENDVAFFIKCTVSTFVFKNVAYAHSNCYLMYVFPSRNLNLQLFLFYWDPASRLAFCLCHLL